MNGIYFFYLFVGLGFFSVIGENNVFISTTRDLSSLPATLLFPRSGQEV